MKNWDISELVQKLTNTIVVSIQPVEGGPLDTTEFVVAMAKAAEMAGAPALRIESVERVAAVAKAVSIPIIGIVKRDLTDSPVRITPFVDDVRALEAAGAAIIAFDATDRVRPESRKAIAEAIVKSRCIGMADCAQFEDGFWAHSQGIELIGSTLSGYTDESTPIEPDFELVAKFAQAGYLTMAEGRFNSPELCKQAIEAGAISVTVGSALTRLEVATSWYLEAAAIAKRPLFERK
ncbi:putative N-acetylmannosamine-6-phosphate 2-epimerase [Vibrio metschnikovii]|nr:putative N-acetylmannosamine-6-phosphate 2-epimerase [Vibrio metschnikovii]EKO3689004.1 putative N-acetylmannosamine-6-phosphate 2-epimerase [Vibrio metschnikovii]EKO3781134.1 putative N-acetylmannosamine-6-phosphate 2-epimerase [Vibrio metschnikovii]EKO3888120.1 putative N-acetylmannosamine-6-phosphate 2-epimerase [Vibrio metschnikovii]EKO3936736.1 putative N-acetylmannosamine-6-phosphate 2-epimerase [Vibrio metschnikovii]